MFLRRYTRKKAGKVLTYYALVESVRTDTGPRQRVVAHLGELNTGEQRRWQRTVSFYNCHGEVQQLRLFADEANASLPMNRMWFACDWERQAGPRRVPSATSGWHFGSGGC